MTIAKLVIFMLLLFYLFSTLQKFDFKSQIISLNISFWPFCIAVILVIVNWGLEARKWQMLLPKKNKLGLMDALKSVLIGLAMGMITPLMSGDFLGRAISVAHISKKKAIAANLVGSYLQTWIAILMGTLSFAALLVYFPEKKIEAKPFILCFLMVLSLGGFLLIILANKIGFRAPKWLQPWLSAITDYKFSRFLMAVMLTFFRNSIFTLQFIILCQAFQIHENALILIIGSGFMFLLKTVAGGLNAIGDLSIRTLFGIHFFTQFGISAEKITLVLFTLWLINIALPALFGGLFLITLKMKKNDPAFA